MQDSWIQNATVRGNILMHAAYDEERYNRVVSACALEQDLATLPSGDATEIGEKGVTLSGEQNVSYFSSLITSEFCLLFFLSVLGDVHGCVDLCSQR